MESVIIEIVNETKEIMALMIFSAISFIKIVLKIPEDVKDNKIIGCGYNQKDKTKNPLKHAELIAIEDACKYIGDWRLNDCTLYTTFEPCMMCMGAIIESRISKVVYGAKKEEQMYYDLKDINIVGGVLEEECLHLLQKFFKNKRNNTKNMI